MELSYTILLKLKDFGKDKKKGGFPCCFLLFKKKYCLLVLFLLGETQRAAFAFGVLSLGFTPTEGIHTLCWRIIVMKSTNITALHMVSRRPLSSSLSKWLWERRSCLRKPHKFKLGSAIFSVLTPSTFHVFVRKQFFKRHMVWTLATHRWTNT